MIDVRGTLEYHGQHTTGRAQNRFLDFETQLDQGEYFPVLETPRRETVSSSDYDNVDKIELSTALRVHETGI